MSVYYPVCESLRHEVLPAREEIIYAWWSKALPTKSSCVVFTLSTELLSVHHQRNKAWITFRIASTIEGIEGRRSNTLFDLSPLSAAHYFEIGGRFLRNNTALRDHRTPRFPLSPGMDRPSRFGYLLEPIRDLTKNWEVDVASQLDDYLSEVIVLRFGSCTTN